MAGAWREGGRTEGGRERQATRKKTYARGKRRRDQRAGSPIPLPPTFPCSRGLPPIRSCCCRCCDVFSPPSLPRFRTANGETFARWPEQKDRCRSEGGGGGRTRAQRNSRKAQRGKCLCRRGGGGGPDGEDGERLLGGCAVHTGRGGGGSVEVHSPQISLNSHTRRRRGRPPCALWCRRWRRWPTATAETETEEWGHTPQLDDGSEENTPPPSPLPFSVREAG